MSGRNKFGSEFSLAQFSGGEGKFESSFTGRDEQIEIPGGPRRYSPPREKRPFSCRSAREGAEAQSRFVETGGANKAPLFQGADRRHKFPFTPTLRELTAKGA